MDTSFNKSEEKLKLKNGKILRIVETRIIDRAGPIKFTSFGDLIDKVRENTGYSMTYLIVGKYNNVCYINTTESTTFTPNDDTIIIVTENDSLNEKVDATISVRICAQYAWPNSSSEIILDEEYVVCNNCDLMSLLSICQSSVAVVCFTGQILNEKLSFQSIKFYFLDFVCHRFYMIILTFPDITLPFAPTNSIKFFYLTKFSWDHQNWSH